MKAGDPKTGWPLRFSAFKPPTAISTPISILLLVVFVACIIIAILALGWLLADLLSGDQKRGSEAAKTALPVLAGAVGLPLIIWRLIILDRQTRISEEKTQIDRETHYTSIFSRSIDQLGQTRELKTSISTEEGITESTKTVPNIEVRLGGIHSLARLAEESGRDREKIGNLLRSYVRENSWSDRTGQITEKLSWPHRSVWPWAYELSSDRHDANAIKGKEDWIDKTKAHIQISSKWAAELPETRVDVNESCDALEIQSANLAAKRKPAFYECLFVGRHFNAQFLANYDFKRCVFARCTFNIREIQGVFATDSQFLNCAFTGRNSEIKFSNSRLGNVNFRGIEGASIALTGCEAHAIRFFDAPSKLSITNTSLYKLDIFGSREGESGTTESASMTINLSGSLLVKASLDNLNLSSASDLTVTANLETKFSNVDLDEVTRYDDNDLAALEAAPNTRQPKTAERPSTWPTYDPAYTDDIPF
jgi:uncharacterized protein YjbI with pentapeptide repeats